MKRFLLLALLWLVSAPTFAQSFLSGLITAAGATCTSTSANCVLYAVGPQTGAVAVVISGTISATLQFEASGDGGNTWVAANASPQPSGTNVNSTTATGTWVIPVTGMTHVRVRCSAYTSGQIFTSINGGYPTPGNATVPVVVPSTVTIQGPIAGGNPCVSPSSTITSIITATSGTTATQIIAASGSKQIFLCSGYFGNGTGTTPTLALQYGTGSNCATGTATLYPAVAIPAGTAAPVQFPSNFFATPASQALCYIQTGTTPTGTLVLSYMQQ